LIQFVNVSGASAEKVTLYLVDSGNVNALLSVFLIQIFDGLFLSPKSLAESLIADVIS
jgi:hypothetical protein